MSHNLQVRYQHFTFPFEVIHDGLQKMVAEPPTFAFSKEEKERENRLLTWLQEKAKSEAEVVDLPDWVSGRRWQAVIAAGIESGLGTVFCPACNKSLPLALVKREHWDYFDMGEKTGVVVAAAGRHFFCPNGHELFRTEDYFGYM